MANCKDCNDRKVGCRSTCEFWAKHEALKASRYAKKEEEFRFQQAVSCAIDRMRKPKNYKGGRS